VPVTFDSNIYVSAFEFGGVCIKLLEMAQDGVLDVAISPAILAETQRVLQRKFGWPESALANIKTILESCTQMVTPTETISAVQDDPDDNRILECAKASGSNAIITRDKHLLQLESYEGIAIVTVADFLRGQARER
jgi:putative PIN family toxin of toxin-antitoxin system